MIRDVLHRKGFAKFAAVGAIVALLALLSLFIPSVNGAPGASAADLHGISFVKGCASPTTVGQPYVCTYQALNTLDTAHDTLTITSVVDVVHASAGDVTSTNLLPTPTTLTLGGGSTCNVGQTLCTLPFNSSITFTASFYNVAPADPNPLTDTATLTFQDTCSAGTPTANCPLGQTLHTQTGSQSEVQTPTPTPTDTATPTATSTDTPIPPIHHRTSPTDTPNPTSTAAPAATPRATSQVEPVRVVPSSTPFHEAEALPNSGSAGGGSGTSATTGGAVVLLLVGGALLGRRRLLRNQK